MHRIVAFVTLAVLARGKLTAPPEGYVHVPGGLMLHKSCVHEVPDGFALDETVQVEKCKFPAWQASNLQIYAIDCHYTLPSGIMTTMNTTWTVPGVPPDNQGQVVYFWPGFKSTVPEMGYPVLQPVLQFGTDSEGGGAYWCLRSWFVWGNQGVAFVSRLIRVATGDKLLGGMSFDASTKNWQVWGKNTQTGEDTTLTIARSRAGNTDFKVSMLVLETITEEGQCNQLPGVPTSVTFSDVVVNGGKVPWTQRVQMKDCHQGIRVDGDSFVFEWATE